METSKDIDQIAMALCRAQGAISNIKKNQINGVGNRYADFSSCYEHVKKHLDDNDLQILQFIDMQNNNNTLTTILLHSTSQQFFKSHFAMYGKSTSGYELDRMQSLQIMLMLNFTETD